MQLLSIMKHIGLNDRESAVYLFLLENGPASVRAIAKGTGINRGSVYEAIKSLQKSWGLTSYYHETTRQYFIAEDPEKLDDIAYRQQKTLESAHDQLKHLLPELRSRMTRIEKKPVVRYYEGPLGVRAILQDVLATMTKQKKKDYYVYSALDVRKLLYAKFPDFAKERIKRKIRVKVIAIGEGGALWGLDERKWLTRTGRGPAYIILYGDKVAMISLDDRQTLHGILLEDINIAATNSMIFEQLYQRLH